MNDTTRDEVREQVAKALCDFDVESNGGYRWEDRSDEWGSDYEYGRNHYRDMARAALAAAHGDADWLDDALDSLPPRSQFSALPIANSKIDGLYRVKVSVHQDGKWWTEYQGQGPTRKAAVLDAVAKARKEATGAH